MNTISLSDIPQLWRAESLTPAQSNCVSTGFIALDEALGGGWPLPALIELLCDEHGIGELRLLLALLKPRPTPGVELTNERKIVLWLSPPFELHVIALTQYGMEPADHWVCPVPNAADLQWAMVQALRSGACQTVIAWARTLKPATLRTLKLAALTGRTVGVLFRPSNHARFASPATLRLGLTTDELALKVTVIKMQGRRPCMVRIIPTAVDAPSSVTK